MSACRAPPAWQQARDATWRDPQGGTCALCHEVPGGCTECHRSSMPESHREAGWQSGHGRGYADAGMVAFERSSCTLCHEENACVRCHQVTKPRNHTLSWQRRFHGVNASVDRERCLVCQVGDAESPAVGARLLHATS